MITYNQLTWFAVRQKEFMTKRDYRQKNDQVPVHVQEYKNIISTLLLYEWKSLIRLILFLSV